jgi:hypothetical protein
MVIGRRLQDHCQQEEGDHRCHRVKKENSVGGFGRLSIKELMLVGSAVVGGSEIGRPILPPDKLLVLVSVNSKVEGTVDGTWRFPSGSARCI